MSATFAVKDLHSTSPLWRAFAEFEARCPDFVEISRWQAAVEDGRGFLAAWGEQAEQLGWTAENLFGLTEVPEKPSPRFDRTARYDRIGLVWLLQKLLVEIYDVVEEDRGVVEQGKIPICYGCGQPAIGLVYGYKNFDGTWSYYHGSHRPAAWYADARLIIEKPIRKPKQRRVLRCRGWVTRSVVGLTETTATIRTSAGATTVYRRNGGGAP
jgi:hypothetical protein